jgi:micrococcal nuclease
MFTYRMNVLKVVDGDTIHAYVDLGFDIYTRSTLRLAHINAPEMSTPAGREAREFLIKLFEKKTLLTLTTEKDKREKYGRYLANVWITDSDGNQASVSDLMVEAGHAVPYEGGKR